MDNFAVIANVFGAGITDVLSFHKILPIFVNNKEIFNETIRILASNMGLLLGSVFMLRYLINPGILHIKRKLGDVPESPLETLEFQFISIFYHCLWVVPIYLLLYISSLAWYQNLASITYKHANGVVSTPSLKTALTQTIYALLVWGIVFAEVQLFLNILPAFMGVVVGYGEQLVGLKSSISLAEFVAGKVVPNDATDRGLTEILKYIAFILPIQLCTLGSYLVGCIGTSLLYGWYGFDYYWIMLGIDADARFALLERYFFYFVGFGLPVTLIMQSCDFFVGYGLNLALFPFLLVLCAATDFKKSFSVHTNHLKDNVSQLSVPVFATPRKWAVSILKFIDKLIRVKKSD